MCEHNYASRPDFLTGGERKRRKGGRDRVRLFGPSSRTHTALSRAGSSSDPLPSGSSSSFFHAGARPSSSKITLGRKKKKELNFWKCFIKDCLLHLGTCQYQYPFPFFFLQEFLIYRELLLLVRSRRSCTVNIIILRILSCVVEERKSRGYCAFSGCVSRLSSAILWKWRAIPTFFFF